MNACMASTISRRKHWPMLLYLYVVGCSVSCHDLPSVQTIWTLSSDTQLTERGDTTGINYRERYESYLEIIKKNLRLKTVAMRETIRIWDDEIFPGTVSSIVRRHDDGEDDDEVNAALAGVEDEEVENSDEGSEEERAD